MLIRKIKYIPKRSF